MTCRRFGVPRGYAVLLLIALLVPSVGLGERPSADVVSFNRDIRPLLSDNCFKCHGPDASQRTTDLRLDTREGLFMPHDGQQPVVPGRLDASELWRRVSSHDPDERMPPADSGLRLTADQIELVRGWIEQGAAWQPHWSFVPPQRPPLPTSRFDEGAGEIDRFVLAKLDRVRLMPSPLADEATRLRRVTLDLTGLPPTPDELDEFLRDESPDAYQRAVDRLLQSPAYGERMAIPWLDAARYADTSGYQNDGPRDMWRWRDWVIESLNANRPFDRFTIEQLAGDLLPNATREQRLATGFHRNHRGNAEGGIIPEEYQVEYVVDRVATTGMVWLGLTLECARCHDHKYDPISQREFYQLYAFFNNIPEHGRAIKEGNSPPYILAPTRAQDEQWRKLERRLKAAERRVEGMGDELAATQAAWEAAFDSMEIVDWTVTDGLVVRNPARDARGRESGSVDGAGDESDGGAVDGLTRGRLRGSVALPSDALPSDALPKGTGQQPQAAYELTGEGPVVVGDLGDFGYFDKFTGSAWIRPTESTGTVLSRMTPTDRGDGYYLHLQDGRLQVHLVKRWLDDAIRIETERRLPLGQWHHVMFTYDGSRVAAGVTVYIDGQPEPCQVRLDAINQSFEVKQPLRIGGGHRDFTGSIDDVRLYARCLTADEARIVATNDSITTILARPASERTAGQMLKLRAYYLDQQAPRRLRAAHRRLVELRRQRETFVENLPTAMVMEEMPEPRETFVLTRGEYDKPAERVEPDVPDCLPALPAGRPDRLALARWLVDRQNPLTARVIVNRQWQLFFGTGLVKTAEDFGVQGEPPSHPELLDWLAVEFIESGWDLKLLHRRIVTSATYQQSSHVTAALVERDPDNRWLARGPRFRLPAEAVRDQALAAAGLLVRHVGGPSVKPYQPDGLWKEIATVGEYDQSQGGDLYRRGLYSYWKRTVAAPTMTTFDATARETCTVQRSRTNTPLQALTLMNDVTFVEAARHLAERAIRDGGDSPDARLRYAFRLATARWPTAREQSVLQRGFERHWEHFQKDREAARALLSLGESPSAEDLDAAELAAYTTVMNLLLNLDEAITRG